VFWSAALERTPVAFDYQRMGRERSTRHLQPWGVVRFSGRWYVVGWDTDRGDERIFRLSRVVGAARLDGKPGSYTIPPGTDVRAIAERLAPAPPTDAAVVLVRPGRGPLLRRRATQITEGVPGPGDGDWDRLELPGGTWSAEELLSLGADLVVEAPESLRADVVARLTAAAGGGS
jgi:proteasome accessory factor B